MLINNLSKIRFVLYFFTVATGMVQLIFLTKTNVDFFSLTLLLLTNLFVIGYCFNDKYFFNYPISLNTIFFSYIMSYGGALYLNTIESSSINAKLNFPIELILYLSFFWLIIVGSHFIYRKFYFFNNLRKKLTNVYFNFDLMNVTNVKFLFFLTFVGFSLYLINLLSISFL